MSLLSLVVATWNSAPELHELLESVADALVGAHEVVVVDNASQDDTVAVAEAWSGPKRVIRLDANRGFGAAANAGVRAARFEVVALLNPDTVLVDDSLVALAKLARAAPGLYGPELLNRDGTRQPSASPVPGGWQVGLSALWPAALLPAALERRCEPWRAAAAIEVGWLTGACLVAPRDLLLELGPFDERLHLYGEDMDLGLRARERGVRRVFAPDVARVVHLGGRSTERRFGDDVARRKLESRRLVVERRLGARRERLDFGAQLAFHVTRYAAKSVLRRDARREAQWLRAALARRPTLSPSGPSPL